jgi:hypothetical protein
MNMKINELIIQELVDKIEVERIFQFTHNFLGKTYDRLLIVLNSKCNVSPLVLEPVIDMVFSEVQDLTYGLIPSGELKSAIINGHLFYNMICKENNQIYHDGKKALPSMAIEGLKNLRFQSYEKFAADYRKGTEFLDGVKFYIGKASYVQATFMLHQSAEIIFRGFENACFKKNRPSHSLHDHIKLLARYIPEISSVFPKNDDYKYGLLKLIDKAYVGVRYDNYLIEEEELSALRSIIEPLLLSCEQFFNDCLADLVQSIEVLEKQTDNVSPVPLPTQSNPKDYLYNTAGINLNATMQKQLGVILNNIMMDHKVLRCISLGSKSSSNREKTLYNSEKQLLDQNAHCFLLVILRRGQMGTSRTIYQGDLKATVLFHDEATLKYALEKRNRFFIQATREGTTLYTDLTQSLDFTIPETDWVHSYKRAQQVWEYNFYHQARTFYESAEAINDYIGIPAIEAMTLLLSQCVEQLCISYIYIHTGYRVDRHNISFLIDLCSMISPEIPEILHKRTVGDKRQIKGLINCIHDIRSRYNPSLTINDIEFLFKRCKDTLDFAKNKCELELNRIKTLAYPEVLV